MSLQLHPQISPSGKRGPKIDGCAYAQLISKDNVKLAKNANLIKAVVLSESRTNVKDRLNLNLFLGIDITTKNKLGALNLD